MNVLLGSGKNMVTISADASQRPFKLREGADRRMQDDRRKSPVGMRLRIGLWYQYHRATRAGEFDPFPRDQFKRGKIEESLLPEMYKYEFRKRDSNRSVPSSVALAAAVNFLWANPSIGCNATGESVAVYAINAIAEHLNTNYQVIAVDRRKAERRAANA